jgi:hypothetical protein
VQHVQHAPCWQAGELVAVPPAGTIGHVAHGKSTVVKAISGVQTVRFKNELERNITIKLGEWRGRRRQQDGSGITMLVAAGAWEPMQPQSDVPGPVSL